MNLKKPVIVGSAIFLLLIVGLPLVMAAQMDPFSSIFDLLKSMLDVVFKLFNLTELGLDEKVNQIAFMRLMVWVITFAIFNTVTKLLFSKSSGLSGSQGADKLPMIISLCLATITAVFTPETILLAIGFQYSALISAILLLGVLGFLLYIAYGVIKPTSFIGHGLRFLIVFVCWMVLMNFTAMTGNDAFNPSISNTSFDFKNSVLSYIWEVLTLVIGVLLVYEIFKMIGSFVGRGTGSGFSNGGGRGLFGGGGRGVENFNDGRRNSLGPLKKEKEEFDQEEAKEKIRKSENNKLKGFTQKKAATLVNLANSNVKLEERLEELKEMLLQLRVELLNLQKTHNLIAVQKYINKIRTGLKNAITEDRQTLARALFVYQYLSREDSTYRKIEQYQAKFEAINEKSSQKEKDLKNQFNTLVLDYNNLLKQYIPKETLEKQDIYNVTRILEQVRDTMQKIEDDLTRRINGIKDLAQRIKIPSVQSLVETIDIYVQHINNAIEGAKSVEGFINIMKNQINDENLIIKRFVDIEEEIRKKIAALKTANTKEQKQATDKKL